MGNLLYSNSAELMTLAQIKLLPAPVSQGPHHHPYPFFNYITDVKDAMELEGMDIISEEYALQHEGQQLFGVIEVELPRSDTQDTTPEWKLLVGIRGSHDQTISRGLVIGSQIVICDNLCFSGAIQLRTKQTTFVEERMPEMIAKAVQDIPHLAAVQAAKFKRYKETEIISPLVDKALVDMFRAGAFSGHQLSIAIRELDKPTYEAHNEYEGTVYGLMQACTQALKPTGDAHNPALAADRSIIVSRLLDALANVENLEFETR